MAMARHAGGGNSWGGAGARWGPRVSPGMCRCQAGRTGWEHGHTAAPAETIRGIPPPASSRGPAPAGILRMPRRADPAYPACHLHSRHASATLSHPSYVRPGDLKTRPAWPQNAKLSKILTSKHLLCFCHKTPIIIPNAGADLIHSRRLVSSALHILLDPHEGFVCS